MTSHEPTLATIANMRRHYQPGVFAYSPYTFEEYSADPADYWDRPDAVLEDSDGNLMHLVIKGIVDVADLDRRAGLTISA